MKEIEILAPGGSKEAIYAAIYGGADAVYTGTDRFSARAYADNPTVEELCGILDFAHLHDKKIYVTINTLLTERELEGSLYAQIYPLYENGLDAVIVQDFGVMDFVREHFPGLAIHASTQMTLLTGTTANLLKPYGVTRIVPARELSIGEIARMREQTDLELEVFVHGALCYCYSGQCLMSQVIGGRSGNRGMCAQPCRLPYVIEGNEKDRGYFLSPKDMCTLGRVGELIEAGVDSFKIEGRMKKPAYAAFTSHLYRLYADAFLTGVPVSDREVRRDIKRLADIYNRGGFSEGYLFEPSKRSIIDSRRNGHFGVRVGEVVNVTAHTVEYRLTEKTNAQDVLEFRDKRGQAIYEYTVKEGAEVSERVTARYKKGCPLKAGQGVYRTKNNELLQHISELISEGKKSSKIKIAGTFTAVCGSPVKLSLAYRDCICEVTGPCAERAEGRPVSREDVEKRLRKTGESEFEFEALEVHVPEGVFLPLGNIAAMRRQAFAELSACICAGFHRKKEGEKKKIDVRTDYEQKREKYQTVVRLTDFRHISGVKSCKKVNANNTRLHVKLDEFRPETWEQLSWEIGDFSYYISLPAVLRDKNTDLFLSWWHSYGEGLASGKCVGVIINSIEALSVLPRMRWTEQWEILAGEGLYLWNRRTADVYRKFGMSGTLYMAYGRTAVMTTEGCVNMETGGYRKPEWGGNRIRMRTPKNDEFVSVNYCQYCYNVIYEKEPSRREPDQTPIPSCGEWTYIPEIAFSFEDAAGVRKVLDQWNFLS